MSPRDGMFSNKSSDHPRIHVNNEAENDMAAFMMELEHLDNISSKNPTLRNDNKESQFESTFDNLLSKVIKFC